ncbi:MAG TPA: hypothetical protein VHY59_12815, partial [Chthoniobacterales bacterium]|nr:hypothetical protein [Chthoniobacterales bacterium]
VFLFRMAGGMVDVVTLGPKAPQELLVQVVADGTTAILIILAMSFGLILSKMCVLYFTRSQFYRPRGNVSKHFRFHRAEEQSD